MARGFQLQFFDDKRLEHGGSLSPGRRKNRRPFSSKKPIHLVLRLEETQKLSLLRHAKPIRGLLSKVSERWKVRLYRYSINSNHLHLLIRAKHKQDFQNFLRHFTGVLAMKLKKTKKGQPLLQRFFEAAYTRIAEWGRPFISLKRYIFQNEQEALGLSAYRPRRRPTRP